MNVDWLSRLPGPLRAQAYFALQRGIGSRIGERWRDFQRWTRLSPGQLENAIDQRLGALLESAVVQSEYYRKLGLIRKKGETAAGFLTRFPVLTRPALRANFAQLVIDSLRSEIASPDSVSPRRYDWLVVKTGGTTGVPTSVVHDALFRDSGRATRLFSQKLCGFPLGTRYFRLWGSEQDLFQQKERLDRAVLKNLLGEIPMNAFRAREAELRRHLQTMRAHPKVRHLMAYIDSAVSLATFVVEHKLAAPKLETIMACAGTVTESARRTLQQVFGVDVFDKYGSRECADIACECAHHTGLHIYSPNVFVEIVDDSGGACPPDKPGRILVTLLNNPSFPMIRYEIGDIGTFAAPGPCPCGLPFPRLKNLQGRMDDMLVTQDGTWITSGLIRHFIGVSLNRQLIQEWQFEQIALNQFVFRYIPAGANGLDENLALIQKGLRSALGESATIALEQVKEIPVSPTGKTLWIINRFRRRTEGFR